MAAGLVDLSWARSHFEEASEAVGADLVRLCESGPEETLAATEFAQAAIFVTSYCLFQLASDKCSGPGGAAGHSLGEYTALVAADAMQFSDALTLIVERARAMSDACAANPGGMAAVLGLSWEEVARICDERRGRGGEIWAANQNAPGQAVVAGSTADLEWLTESRTDLGAKRVLRLSVSGAFHSPFMAPAVARLRDALAVVPFESPSFPVWSNVTGEPHGSPGEIRDLLAEQLVEPVRWTDCLVGIAQSGASELICFGPGDAVAGMARRCVEGAEIVRAENLQGIEATAEPEVAS